MSKAAEAKAIATDVIYIKGAALNNLKNIDVSIPRNKLVLITGLSGSGKSSLAFDTLYAEGQRRYVESLSSYARQFLGRLSKPKVEFIKGITPAIAITQKVTNNNPRSTVGTTTEIYEYLKLLFARIGKTFDPKTGKEIKKHSVSDVIDYVKSLDEGTRILLLSPLSVPKGKAITEYCESLSKQGFSRIKVNGTILRLDNTSELPKNAKQLELVVDRSIVRHDEDFYFRLGDAVDIAFYEGHGTCRVEIVDTVKRAHFSNIFGTDEAQFPEPDPQLFSFNNPYGACPTCEGFGDIIGLDEDLVIPNTDLSIYEGAIAPWRTENMSFFKNKFIENAHKFNFPVHTPWHELSDEERDLIWTGNQYFYGLNDFFEELEAKAYKIQNRVLLSRYRGRTRCKTCKGGRLRKEATYVKIDGYSIDQLSALPIDELTPITKNLKISDYDQKVAERLLLEINNRLQFMQDVGLGYLSLNRKSNTLSGGESQRINLATSLGSSLVGSTYILDEPSIGLHSRDTERLISILKRLRDLGNTVVVVEHDEDIMKAADYIIDIGPGAGVFGGEVVACGSYKDFLTLDNSLTAEYLSGRRNIALPKKRRISQNYIEVVGARANNLKNITVRFPLESLCVVTGVSGSGKSTLVRDILYPAVLRKLGINYGKVAAFSDLIIQAKKISAVEFVDQNPIGRSSRSNPVTYIKAYDDIRQLFARQKASKLRNFQPKHFSFNVDGGRCPECKGEGEVTIEMQFMADVQLVCEACQGNRFKKEVLEVNFAEKNIAEILSLSVDEAVVFFNENGEEKIAQNLQPLIDVGLGYVSLGQSSSTLSGGEAQRIKLASFLIKKNRSEKVLFIFDEPSTGLHFHDIKKLLDSFNALITLGHSVVVIEHHPDIIKSADYIIDLGPEGGKKGGQIVAAGTPEKIAENKNSFTGKYIREKLN